MASPSTLVGDYTVQGNLTCTGTISSPAQQYLNSNASAIYGIPFTDLREVTAFNTVLPSAGTGAHLGLYGGTIGSNGPLIATGDIKTTSGTRSARFQFCLPPEYVAGGTVVLRASGGMQTTVASTTANVDFQAYKLSRTAAAPSADLCATAAQSINSLTFADKSFTVTATTLSPGDWLDVEVDLIYVDAATGTVVNLTLGAIEVLLQTHG